MNIIFGEHSLIEDIHQRHAILELDTMHILQTDVSVPTYYVVENMPTDNMNKLDAMRELHSNLISEYRKRNWKFCEDAIEHLTGFWGKEADSFYVTLTERIAGFKKIDPGSQWDWRIQKQGVLN